MKKVMLLYVLWSLLFIGCRTFVDEQGNQVTMADPNAIGKVEIAAEAAVGTAGALSLFWPALAPLAGIAAGILGTWRKMKPQVMAKTTEAGKYYTAGEVLAATLEDIKTTQPDTWAKIGPAIEKALKPATAVENTIRGFRHLPPKQL